MVLNHRTSSISAVVLAIMLFMINGVELKRQNSPGILRLVEIETVDDEGLVRARVVAEYKPTDSETRKTREDDEDLKDASSGDSEGIYGDSYDMVANDEPMAQSSNHSSSESSGLVSHDYGSNVSTTSTPVTSPVDSKTSTVAQTTKGQIYTSSLSPTTVLLAKNIETTTAVSKTSKPTTLEDKNVTFTTTGKANVTTLSTLSPSSKDMQTNLTTFPSKVTEVTANLEITNAMATTTLTPKTNEIKRTTGFNVTSSVSASTIAKTNFNNQGINQTSTKASTTTNTTPTKRGNINIQGQKDPGTKSRRRKALFGFVTVEILIALLAGALFSILLVAFLVYRLKKRNEGSYELSETIALRPKEISDMSNKKEVFV